MANINIDKRGVPRTARNGRIYMDAGTSSSSSSSSSSSAPVTELLPTDNILEWDETSKSYKPYADRIDGDEWIKPYFYEASGIAFNYPVHTLPVYLDGSLTAFSLEASKDLAGGNYVTYFLNSENGIGIALYNGVYKTFSIKHDSSGALVLSANSGTTSDKIYIGSKTASGSFHGEHILIDDFLQTFSIKMTNTKAYGLLMSTNSAEDQYSALNLGDFTQRKSTTMVNQSTYNSATELTSGSNIFNKLIAYNKSGSVFGQFKELINAAENWTTSSRAVEWIIQTVKSGMTTLEQRLKIDKDGQFIIGSATDNTTFSPTGTQRMNGSATVWNDLNIPGLAVRTAGINDPVLSSFGSTTKIYTFSGSQMNEVFFTVQNTHGYKEGSSIEPHIHWAPMTSPATSLNVRFGLDYQWQNYTAVFTATDSTVLATGATGTMGYKHQITSFGTLSGTDKSISSVLVCRLYRLPADAADTYTGDVGLLSIDFHFESDSLGSNTEYGK